MNAAEFASDFARGMRVEFGTSRNDEQYIHARDVYGCGIALDARLRGRPMLSPSVETLVKWQLGHAGEAIMATALRRQLMAKGYTVETDVLLWMSVHEQKVWAGRLNRAEYPARLMTDTGQHLLPARTIVGHADLLAVRVVNGVVERALLEAKTERTKAKEKASDDYAIQSSIYALMAAGSEPAGPTVVGVIDVRSGDWIFYDVDVSKERPQILELAAKAIAVYTYGPLPGTTPFNPRACSWCDYGACPSNTNKERLSSLEGIF